MAEILKAELSHYLPDCRCAVARREAPVVDGRRVVEVRPGEVLVGCRSRHRGQAVAPELSLPVFGDQGNHAAALDGGKSGIRIVNNADCCHLLSFFSFS